MVADCIILGGGVIGLMTALELRKVGAKVLVIDRGEFGCESSWAGGGLLYPLHPWDYSDPINLLAKESQTIYPKLVNELQQTTGIDSELLCNGILLLGINDFTPALSWAEKYNYKCHQICTSEIRSIAPGISEKIAKDALYLPKIMQVRNPRLMRALIQYIEQVCSKQIELRSMTEARCVNVANGRICGVEMANDKIECENVVIACGAWSDLLLRDITNPVDIYPVRSQMILYQRARFKSIPTIWNEDHYLIPRKDGHLLVGSTLENVGYDKSTTHEAKLELKNAAERILPELSETPIVKHWSGLRPACGRGAPLISKIASVDGLYINSGHFRNGLLLAPASARMLTDIITGRPTSATADYFSAQSS